MEAVKTPGMTGTDVTVVANLDILSETAGPALPGNPATVEEAIGFMTALRKEVQPLTPTLTRTRETKRPHNRLQPANWRLLWCT